jgi:hypothetical protein
MKLKPTITYETDELHHHGQNNIELRMPLEIKTSENKAEINEHGTPRNSFRHNANKASKTPHYPFVG